MYVWRSLKRGYTRRDIGISAFKAQRIKFKKRFENFKEFFGKEPVGKSFDKGIDKVKNILKNWE